MKINYTIRTEPNTKETVKRFERLRYNVLNIDLNPDEIGETAYTKEMLNAKILIVGLYDENDTLLAGCYVSNTFETLFIEYLFVRTDYQEKGLKLGQTLLKYILDHKEIYENFFHTKARVSTLFSLNEKTQSIYESLGYRESNKELNLMIKPF